MHDLLQQCRSNFGEAPRQLSTWERLTYLRVPKPFWLWNNSSDELITLFRHTGELFRNGTVVWGHVIQANQLMFEDGLSNCSGELVYSIDDFSSVDPASLKDVAEALYDLKGTTPSHPDLVPIARYLTDEMSRVFRLPVPRSISPLVRCWISSTFFVRKHLPLRRLCAPLLPVIVNRRTPHVAILLPERYWPRRLVAWWTQ